MTVEISPVKQANHYVAFRLGKEAYAIDVALAREIVDSPKLRQLPAAPAWIPGLMNLRGRVVPVVDLKKKFELGGDDDASRGYVIVVELVTDGEPFAVGVLADAVLEVFELLPEDLSPAPRFGARFSRTYLRGMARRNDEVLVVMDAEKVLSDSDVRLAADDDAWAA
jgi:purine-binding chemotaxis protein CheW